ncbi:hypothetical protein ABTZ93_33270 [Streptomyces sp. NPDC097941]|uniref:hypothetical protein n=1 Tax=Streptomyces sp. NPDC097941 TaxID=3155685 RepID=UPI0033247568
MRPSFDMSGQALMLEIHIVASGDVAYPALMVIAAILYRHKKIIKAIKKLIKAIRKRIGGRK